MSEGVYRVAREVARRVAEELELTPPFDVAKVAARFALVIDEDIPTRSDVVALHAARPGDQPRIVVEARLSGSDEERKRFAIAHGLGHVLLGWHPLGTPCDVADRPLELPVTVHDLVEGEANAFARELLLPRTWIKGFDAFDRPAQLIRHVAERGGVLAMPAARSVALQLPPGWVWAVTDAWGRALDAGRSLGTSICSPTPGEEL
ncbi:MAG: ImmA/IrrE family metallo-endopeptidase, partial [Gaiellales bacterium]